MADALWFTVLRSRFRRDFYGRYLPFLLCVTVFADALASYHFEKGKDGSAAQAAASLATWTACPSFAFAIFRAVTKLHGALIPTGCLPHRRSYRACGK